MANTSRPCSLAKRAVIKEPEARAASTTKVPHDRPAMDRGCVLGKLAASGGVPKGNSLQNQTVLGDALRQCLVLTGVGSSKPVPTTAMVAKAVVPWGTAARHGHGPPHQSRRPNPKPRSSLLHQIVGEGIGRCSCCLAPSGGISRRSPERFAICRQGAATVGQHARVALRVQRRRRVFNLPAGWAGSAGRPG